MDSILASPLTTVYLVLLLHKMTWKWAGFNIPKWPI